MSPNDDMPFAVPESVAVCPICEAPIVIEEVQDWEELNGKIVMVPETTVTLTCTTEPDIDGPDWNDWMSEHFSMPYVDWLPLSVKVRDWLAYNAPTTWNQTISGDGLLSSEGEKTAENSWDGSK